MSKTTIGLIIFVSVLPFALIASIRNFDLLQLLEAKAFDTCNLLTKPIPISPKITLIKIDAESQSDRGIGQLPWPPYVYASLLENLRSSKPSAIGLILWFNRDWGTSEKLPGDDLFAIRSFIADDHKSLDLPIAQHWNQVPKTLISADEISFSVFPLSRADGIFRTAQLAVRSDPDQKINFSLEILMLCDLHNVPKSSVKIRDRFWHGKFIEIPTATKTIRIPIDPQGRTFLKRTEPQKFDQISFIDALQNPSAEIFRDRLILIGITTEDVPQATTPFGKMSALDLRATLINSLFQNQHFWKVPPRIEFLIYGVLTLVMITISISIFKSGRNYRSQLIASLAILTIYLLIAITLFVRFSICVPIAGMTIAIVACGFCVSLLIGHIRLHEVFNELKKTQSQLVRSEKEAVIGVMAARVRHELRNVLNLIRSPAEMIRKNFQKGDPLGMIENPHEIELEMGKIIDRVGKLDEMIENELSFFREGNFNFQPSNLGEIIQSAIATTQNQIDEKSISVSIDLPSNLPSINLDIDKIKLTFVNLIRNACQAMDENGELKIEIDHVSDHVLIKISDDGCGIPKSDRSHIFDAFFTTKPRGLGMGLINVKNIVEGHRGRIWFESEIDVGTTFYLELPIL